MKKTSAFFTLILVLVLQYNVCYAQGKDGALLASPYPGSVVEPNPVQFSAPTKAMTDARLKVFYSKDTMEKIREHYTKLLGAFEVSPSGDHIFTHQVIPFKDVAEMVTKKGGIIGEGGDNFWGGTSAGVTLYGKSNNTNYSVVKVFEKLQGAYLLRTQNLDNPENSDPLNAAKRLEDPELKKIVTRYEYLKWSYFMQSTEKKKDDPKTTLSMDEALFNKYFVAPAEARQKEIEVLSKKMTEATTLQKFDEAGKIGDRLTALALGQMDGKEDWKAAQACLKEMETVAYATIIVIDTHPSKWDLTPPKN